ncbi:frizzled-4-like [Watersipora subatra]|uniref:frizzled-4-like n=1 Tax=Watersipora subatra TaxID=2589382 RepID=UPI00355C1216
MDIISKLLLSLLLLGLLRQTCCYLEDTEQCEPIRIDMCPQSILRYNMTGMPNYLGHRTQEEAITQLRLYSQLVNLLNCSQHINFFLCSLFVPMCTDQMDGPLVINVCQSMCLQVKSDCEPVISHFNLPWPLNCSRLPVSNGKKQLCMAPKDGWVTPPSQVVKPEQPEPDPPTFHTPLPYLPPSTPYTTPGCPPKYVRYDNSSCTDLCDSSCKDCVPICDDVLFSKEHKNFAYAWMTIWASLCIASTLFTIVTFCIDPTRFRYPTRPIIFMAFCYFMYALAHFIPLFIPAQGIICKSDEAEASLMIVSGMESTLCIIIFLIQYYFGIASHIWWMILTLSWYLAASRKWGLEAISSISCYFHLFAWAVPAVLTIAILVTGAVDSNELTGMCYVGNHDKWSLLVYIIIPMCFLLLLGEIFLLAGFISLLQIRPNLKTQVDNINIRKLEKLMAKIGIFAILYTVPAVCILGAHVHEFINIDAWRCMSAVSSAKELTDSIPTVEIHMLKIFMSLIIGVSICMWVLSSKTLKSCERQCCSKTSDSQLTRSRRMYRKEPAFGVAAPTQSTSCSQHYKFSAKPHTMSLNHTHMTHGDAASL